MAELLDQNEMLYLNFQPRMKNHFAFYVEGIPAFMIKTAKKPSINFGEVVLDHMNVKSYFKGKGEWQPIDLTLHDPISPSGQQTVMEWVRLHHESVTGMDGYKKQYAKDCTIVETGPLGDKVGQWTLKNAWITSADFGDLDMASEDPQEISLTLRYDFAIGEY